MAESLMRAMSTLIGKMCWAFTFAVAALALLLHPLVGTTKIDSNIPERIRYLCLGHHMVFDFSGLGDGVDGKRVESIARRLCGLPVQLPGQRIVSARTQDGNSGIAMNYLEVERSEAIDATESVLLEQGWQQTEASILARKREPLIDTAVFKKNGAILTTSVVGKDNAPRSRITAVIIHNVSNEKE